MGLRRINPGTISGYARGVDRGLTLGLAWTIFKVKKGVGQRRKGPGFLLDKYLEPPYIPHSIHAKTA